LRSEWVQSHLDTRLGDIVRLKKPHPCGSSQWEVVRLGADIGLRCLGCGRRVLLPRDTFRRRIREIKRRKEESDASASEA
jgi:hypothetical protein